MQWIIEGLRGFSLGFDAFFLYFFTPHKYKTYNVYSVLVYRFPYNCTLQRFIASIYPIIYIYNLLILQQCLYQATNILAVGRHQMEPTDGAILYRHGECPIRH